MLSGAPLVCRAGALWLGWALVLAACGAVLPPAGRVLPRGDATLYVIERGWHTDIGLTVAELDPPLAALTEGSPGVRFLTFGFGERAFYTSRHPTVADALRALLPSQSAMLMTALSAPPQDAFGADKVVAVHVTRSGLARVEMRIWNDMERPDDGGPRPIAEGPYLGSVYFATRTTYDLLNTCNTWTAEMLRTAGLPVNPDGMIFVGQVMRAARWIAEHHAG